MTTGLRAEVKQMEQGLHFPCLHGMQRENFVLYLSKLQYRVTARGVRGFRNFQAE